MTVANVALTDTFDQWRTKTNQLIVYGDQTNALSAYAINASNLTFTIANNIYAYANNVANNVYVTSNASFNISNIAYSQSNLAHTKSNAAYLQSNTALTQANLSWDQSNAVYTIANAVYAYSNISTNLSIYAANTSNNVYGIANSTANAANAWANSVGIAGNSYTVSVGAAANNYANSTYYLKTGGTVTGNVAAGNVSATGIITDSKGDVRKIPLSSQSSGYTLTISDVGKVVSINGTVNVPTSVFSSGDAVSIYNTTSGTITIAAGSATVRLAGTGLTGSRSLSQYGLASLICVDGSSNLFVIGGSGVT